MKQHFGFIDPSQIVSVIVVVLIMGIGSVIVMTIISSLRSNGPSLYTDGGISQQALNNTSTMTGSVFNIVGVVLIIAAIMSIIGLIYTYVR